jgi:hypothetical protein
MIAKAPIERFIARGRLDPLALVWAVEIERRRRGQECACAAGQPPLVVTLPLVVLKLANFKLRLIRA